MTVEDADKSLPLEREIQIMEASCEEPRAPFEQVDLPQGQQDLLDRRRARVKEGTARLLDWESVKGTIGRA